VVPWDGILMMLGEWVRGSHAMSVVAYELCSVKPSLARAKCNFAMPLGMLYKYPMDGIVIEDEL
jgi:hypothetical protein